MWWVALIVAVLIIVFVVSYFIFLNDRFINLINKRMKKNNSTVATGLVAIILFFILSIVFIVLAYEFCDLITGNDIIKSLVCTVLPVFLTFVSTIAIFASESDRGDAQERKSVMPYLTITDYSCVGLKCNELILKNVGVGTACNIKIYVFKSKLEDFNGLCINKSKKQKIRNIKLYSGKQNSIYSLRYEDIYGNEYKQVIQFKNYVPKLKKTKLVDKKEVKKEKKKKKKQKSDKK